MSASLVADRQPAEAVEPGQGALDHPAVAPQPLAGVDRPCGRSATLMCAPAQRPAAAGDSRTPCRRAAWPGACAAGRRALDRRDGVEQLLEDDRCRGGWRRSGRTASGMPRAVDHDMALRARFAAIRRVRAGRGAPLLAGTLALSRQARLQSIWSASPSRSSSARWSRVPDPGRLPVAQAPPAGHARAAAQLLGQHLPGDAGLEHEDDAGQGRRGPARAGGRPWAWAAPAAAAARSIPQLVADQGLAHAGRTSQARATVLIGALSSQRFRGVSVCPSSLSASGSTTPFFTMPRNSTNSGNRDK